MDRMREDPPLGTEFRAPGGLTNEGNGSRIERRPERPFPLILSGRLGRESSAEAIIFFILLILLILSKQFPQFPLSSRATPLGMTTFIGMTSFIRSRRYACT